MIRYKIGLSFLGCAYHGWQIQPNALSVQETLEKALGDLFGETIRVSGCSRTDSGVHAREFYCHFDAKRDFPQHKLPLAVRAYLPDDITVFSCEKTDRDFHARFSCKGKTYSYTVDNGAFRDPMAVGRAAYIPTPLSAESMHSDGQAFLGKHDFASFCAAGSSVSDTVRTVTQLSVRRFGDRIVFTVSGDGFLYHMVRNMVGTLIERDLKGKTRSIEEILEKKDRALAGPTAPAEGLTLEKVYY